ncbi:MAG: histidinol-phosphate transaminase [Chitinophagaceae bacterium]|nr:MAG: histidinol-phosphate transaminase [Chitinophagaceae bacterium]
MKDISSLVRENIKLLKPYSSARNEFKGDASVFLDANENAFGSPIGEFNRYPDPLQWQLKFQLARIKGVPAENIALGNGSDEIVDLLFRIFCEPAQDNVIICPPTYGMYEVCARINNVAVKAVPLTGDFQLDPAAVLKRVDRFTKLIWICSPNNPTGNSMGRDLVLQLLENFSGIVVIDEAYINYSGQKTFIPELLKFPNLVIMQTLSKAWGLAALRLGICFASLDIIDLINKIKPPYNINQLTQELSTQALGQTDQVNEWIRTCIQERGRVANQLNGLSFIKKIYPSDANFLLIKCLDADGLYAFLASQKIVVRNRNTEQGCEGCVRITIGTAEENTILIEALKQYDGKY